MSDTESQDLSKHLQRMMPPAPAMGDTTQTRVTTDWAARQGGLCKDCPEGTVLSHPLPDQKPRGEQCATFFLGPHFPQLHAQVPEGISLGSSFLTSECSALPRISWKIHKRSHNSGVLHSHEIVLQKPPHLPPAFSHRSQV